MTVDSTSMRTIAGFGDPGVQGLRARVGIPVIGPAVAAIVEAVGRGRRYSIVIITPDLNHSLLKAAQTHGEHGHLASIRHTVGEEAGELMRSTPLLEHAPLKACELALTEDGAQAIVIGGGPLAQAARHLAARFRCPVINPVEAAVRAILRN